MLRGAHASGEPNVVGQSKNPQTFKRVAILTILVHYCIRSSAWMSRENFEYWFFTQLCPRSRNFSSKKNGPVEACKILIQIYSNCKSRESKYIAETESRSSITARPSISRWRACVREFGVRVRKILSVLVLFLSGDVEVTSGPTCV